MFTSLPYKCKDFAADVFLAGAFVGHNALRGGNDGDAEASHDPGHVLAVGLTTQAGLRNPAQPGATRGLAVHIF